MLAATDPQTLVGFSWMRSEGPHLHDVLDEYLHGFFRNEELFGDVAIAVSAATYF
jgi:hypothetical protein